MAGIKAKVIKGGVWISASRAVTSILAFAGTLVLARLLVPEDFGLVALATTMLAIVNAFTDLSMTSALIHHRNTTDDHFHTAFTLNLLRAAAVAILFCLFAPLAGNIYGDPHLPPVMYALGLSVFIGGLANPRRVMLSKDLIFWQDFLLNVTQKLTTLIVSVAIAFMYRSYWALVAGMLAGQIAGALLSYTALPFRPRIAFRHARELWSFSVWLTLGQMINTLNWKFDHLLIGTFLGRAPLGFYTMGDNLAVMPTREATAPLTQTLFPGFAKHSTDLDWLRNAYQQAQGVVTAIVLPIGVGMALVADPIVRLAMGEKWLPVTIIVQILASVFAIQTLGTLVQPLAMAKGMTKVLFKRNVLFFAMRIPIIIAGLYVAGLPGIVIARAMTGCIGTAINMRLVKEIIGLGLWQQVRSNVRAIASVAIMAVSVLAVQALIGRHHHTAGLIVTLAASVATGGVAYIASNLCLWWAMGCPKGAETELARMISLAFAMLRPQRPSGIL